MKKTLLTAATLLALGLAAPATAHDDSHGCADEACTQHWLYEGAGHTGGGDTIAATRYGTWGIDTAGMDASVAPGADFFGYANGAWAKNTAIPADQSSYGSFRVLRDLSEARIDHCPDPTLTGLSFTEVAERRGVDPVDAFLDLQAEFGNELRWTTTVGNRREDSVAWIVAHPQAQIGFSDAGAHLRNMAFYNFPLHLLRLVQRRAGTDRPVMSLGRAVHRVTGELAEYLDIPREIRSRRPTTDTYSLPQSQEEFYFALPYQLMDICLLGLNQGASAEAVAAAAGLTEAQVHHVWDDIASKRKATRHLHTAPMLAGDVPEVEV